MGEGGGYEKWRGNRRGDIHKEKEKEEKLRKNIKSAGKMYAKRGNIKAKRACNE
jgi:hypothetical protein